MVYTYVHRVECVTYIHPTIMEFRPFTRFPKLTPTSVSFWPHTVNEWRLKVWEVCLNKLTRVEHSLLLTLLAVLTHKASSLDSSKTSRVSCTAPGGFTAMTTASSSPHQSPPSPTLLHSSSLRMYLTECRVFSTVHTSNKEQAMQLQQNKHTPNTVTY